MSMSSPQRRWLLVLACAAVAVLALMRGSLAYGYWNVYRDRPFYGMDFYFSYVAQGALMREGAHGLMYHEELVRPWLIERGRNPVFPDTPYPPLTALLAVPFATMDKPEATFTFFQICHVWLALAAALILLPFGLTPARWLLVYLAAALAAPTLDCLAMGQLGILTTLLTIAFGLCYARGHRVAAGALLGLNLSCKFYSAPFVLYLVARRDWKTLGSTLLAFCVWNMAVLAYVGVPDGLRLFATYYLVSLPKLVHTISRETDQSFLGVSKYILGTGAPGVILSLGVLAWSLLAVKRHQDETRTYGEIALFTLVQMMCIGRSWTHYHVLLLATVGFLAVLMKNRGAGFEAWLGLLGLTFALCLLDGEVDVTDFRMEFRRWVLGCGVPLLCFCGLWVLTLRSCAIGGAPGNLSSCSLKRKHLPW